MIWLNENSLPDPNTEYPIGTTETAIDLSVVAAADVPFFENETGVDIDTALFAFFTGGTNGKRPSDGATVIFKPFTGEDANISSAHAVVNKAVSYIHDASPALGTAKYRIYIGNFTLIAGHYLFLSAVSDNGADDDIRIGVNVYDVSSNVSYAANGKPQVDTFSVGGAAPATQINANVVELNGNTSAAGNIRSTYDGTGYADGFAPATQTALGAVSTSLATVPKYVLQTTIVSVPSSNTIELFDGADDLDVYNDMIVTITSVSSGDSFSKRITNWAGASTAILTVEIEDGSPFPFALSANDLVDITRGTTRSNVTELDSGGPATGDNLRKQYDGSTGLSGDTFPARQGALQSVIDVVSHADYGNAQLVRSTVPANTLNVSSTGKADTSAGTTIPPGLR